MRLSQHPGWLVFFALISAAIIGFAAFFPYAPLGRSESMMSKLKHFIVTGLCAAIGATAAVSAHAQDLWDAFKTASVDNARVVDRSDERKITTSEGQSYALFFALAADDRTSFDALLSWTRAKPVGRRYHQDASCLALGRRQSFPILEDSGYQ